MADRLEQMARRMEKRKKFVEEGKKRKAGHYTASQTGARQLAEENFYGDPSMLDFEDVISGKKTKNGS